MALVIKDRVRQTSTTAGTGTITLSGSVTGYQDFTVIGTGNTTYYTIADQSGSNWEVGLGTYIAPNQLARTVVYESSNGNALVNFGSNIKDVFVTLPAEAVPTGTISGSGTTNYVPKFTGTSAIGNSLIYDNGTNVGIGTASPTQLLTLAAPADGGISLGDRIYTGTKYIGTTGAGGFGGNSTYIGFQGTSPNVFGNIIYNAHAGTHTFRSATTNNLLHIDVSGNVGIGTASPTTKLDVNGTTRFGATGADTITLRGQVSANSSVGTSGQVLTSQGANLPPQWTTPSGSGTVTSITASTTPVNGLSLSGGTITSSGTIGITGTLDLSAPPAIGGTTPNTITGTTVTAKTDIQLPEKINLGNDIYGVIEMQDGGDGYDYINIYGTDIYSNIYPAHFPAGLAITGGNLFVNSAIGSPGYVSYGNGAISGYIRFYDPTNTNNVKVQAATTFSDFTLTLPTSAGSNNQVLKTDGTGNLSWVNLNAPSIYTTASSQNSTSATLANITGLTATLAANTTYRVDCFVTFQSAATTTGINFGFTSPTGTTCMLEVVVPITNTAAASQLRTIFPNNSSTNAGSVLGTGVSTINSNHTARFSGIITVGGTGGTFAAQYATEVAASAITIPAGSTMVIQQIS